MDKIFIRDMVVFAHHGVYDFEKETKSYLRKSLSFNTSRKLVILKSMIKTTEKSLQLFDIIEKYQNKILKLPTPLLNHINEQLLNISMYQDKIYSKYEGKILSSSHHSQNKKLFKANWSIFQEINEQVEDPDTLLEVQTVLVLLGDYSKRLDHLDRLIDSYYTYHQKQKN